MNNLTQYFNLTKERLKSATPLYFKKIIYFGVILGGLGLSLALAGTLVPIFIHTLSGYLITIGIVSATVAKTTTCDPDITSKSEEFLKSTKHDSE